MLTIGTIRRLGSTSCPHAKLTPAEHCGGLLVCRAFDSLEVEAMEARNFAKSFKLITQRRTGDCV